MASVNELRRLLSRISRDKLVLPAWDVDRIIDLWCDKHYYRRWQAEQSLFAFRATRPWFYYAEDKWGRPYCSLWDGVDIELEPPVRFCVWCNEPLWTGRGAHCGGRPCKDMDWFWHWGLQRWPRARPMGKAMHPYMIAEYIKRMAKPTTERDREFSKRYAHRT